SIETSKGTTLAYTFLAGHFDQRAYYALQAGKLVIENSKDFTIRSSTVIVFDSILPSGVLEKIRTFLINRADTRERELDFEEIPIPTEKHIKDVSNLKELTSLELTTLKEELALTMNIETLIYIQSYYKEHNKQATETELLLFDTYWSDHCRHTTFLTELGAITFNNKYKDEIESTFNTYLQQRKEMSRTSAITLMDLATHSARYLTSIGKLNKVEESQEVNACSICVSDEHDEYLLMFKNETHNHPTEIEPFGGAQTCLGGAIRDPLSGRSYVYQGVRISGSGDPRGDVKNTLKNKLPQSTIAKESARGFSSYGNQIGMATTLVKEMYHPSYVAKHLELGAVVGITRRDEVIRQNPAPGDIVILLGGRTGKDGIGGASGSSVSHTYTSLDTSYAQIQKGNPLEERKLQRLFAIPQVKKIIKCSNDFGAGGVSVAIGELAPGIIINLDAIPLKTKGMNATEIAISESQERMAIVIEEKDLNTLILYANKENVEYSHVATVTQEKKLIMRHKGEKVVDIDRSFLDTNGLIPTQDVEVIDYTYIEYDKKQYHTLNEYSQKGLGELFDSSVGYSTLYSPYGGVTQTTPELSSVHRFPLHTTSHKASVVSYGFDPTISEESLYKMGMCSVISSVSKQIATGAHLKDIYLSFQEYFPAPHTNPKRWGFVLEALLGAFKVCDALQIAPIGGKDSMSGTFENLDVIPTLISFAFGEVEKKNLRSRAFKSPDEYIYILKQEMINGLPDINSFKQNIFLVETYRGDITAISTLCEGLSYSLNLMSIGNEIGFICDETIQEKNIGGFIFTSPKILKDIKPIGRTTNSFDSSFKKDHLQGLRSIYPFALANLKKELPKAPSSPKRYYHKHIATPVVLILTFSGTNSEIDIEKNFKEAGGETHLCIVNDTNHEVFSKSIDTFIEELEHSHILVIPGGFSFSDEPDGSGKYIAAFLKNTKVRRAIDSFIEKDHLILGICNGFQGLIKSGLLPYGTIQNLKETDSTLFFNDSYRHVARLVQTNIHSSFSPWLQELDTNIPYTLPVSHSEGKFVTSPSQLSFLIENNLIATTYLDNPNGSEMNIEGIVSMNGNILGKMGHNERINNELFINVDGSRRQDIFMSGITYFTKGGKVDETTV
ncbi:MAG: phosphoribosylformylglycinamidine synthase, partial [Spirochaetia bacterium]|nr:phosphoribosylformylglycinamidine synthase [Spirochaetia bacterium]